MGLPGVGYTYAYASTHAQHPQYFGREDKPIVLSKEYKAQFDRGYLELGVIDQM